MSDEPLIRKRMRPAQLPSLPQPEPQTTQRTSPAPEVASTSALQRRKDYEIGYRKPPKHSQFKAGRSGNPRGRPKGRKNGATLLEEALGKKITVSEQGRRKTVSSYEAMIMQLVIKAVKGDLKAVDKVIKLRGGFGPATEGQASRQDDNTELPPEQQAILQRMLAGLDDRGSADGEGA